MQILKTVVKKEGTIVFMQIKISNTRSIGTQNDWHAYLFIYYDKQVIIVDPNYTTHDHKTRRLCHIVGTLMNMVMGEQNQRKVCAIG